MTGDFEMGGKSIVFWGIRRLQGRSFGRMLWLRPIFLFLTSIGGRPYGRFTMDGLDSELSGREDGAPKKTKLLSLSRSKDKVSVEKQEKDFRAVPFYAFGNRGPGEMAVWLAREESRVELPPAPTIASTSRASSSCGNGTFAENYPGHKLPSIAQAVYPNTQDGSGDIRAISDQLEPVNSKDGSSYFLRLRPQSGDRAWVQYDFSKATKVSSVDVYWKDDAQYCPVPSAWRLVFKVGNEWTPVKASDVYGVEKDKFNTVHFEPVTTTALRLEIQLQAQTYKKGLLGPPDGGLTRNDTTWYEGGLIEWRVNIAAPARDPSHPSIPRRQKKE